MIFVSDPIPLLIGEQCGPVEHCGIATTRENDSFSMKRFPVAWEEQKEE